MFAPLLPLFSALISIFHPTSRFLLEPSGLRLSFTEHPHEVALVWSSALPLWDPHVLIKEIDCTRSFESPEWTSVKSEWVWNFREYDRMWEVVYRTMIPDVRAECKYEYLVGSGLIWTQSHTFTAHTPYDPAFPTSIDLSHATDFIVFGDMGNGPSSVPSRELMSDFLDLGHVDGILHMGDIAYNLDTYTPGISRAYFAEMEPIASRIPYMVLPGNHEIFHNYTQYIQTFRMPVNSANDGLGKFYSFDLGRAHFVLFSSDTLLSAEHYEKERQLNWLKEDLRLANTRRPTIPWLIVLSHKPYYCQSDYTQSFAEHTGLENNWDCSFRAERVKKITEELFFSESVDIVMSGHVHNYQRTFPLHLNLTIFGDFDDEHKHVNAKAPVFILGGAAGNVEGNDPISVTPQLWCAAQSRALGVGRLQILNSTHLYWEQWDALNKTVIDYVWLEKNRTRY